MKTKLSILSIVMSLLLCACSANESPTVSEFPRIATQQPSSSTEADSGASPEASQAAPAETLVPIAEFVPDENAPIQFSVSFATQADIKDTRVYLASMEYMRRHPDVYIEFKYKKVDPYSTEPTDFVNKTIEDIRNGTSADIVMMEYNYPVRTIQLAGNLLDFEELIENDRNISRSDFLENILDGMKFENSLYVMPLCYHVFDYAINKKYANYLDKPFNEYETIDYKTMMSVYEKAINANKDNESIFMETSAGSDTAFVNALDLYTVNFDSESVDIYNEEKYVLAEKALNLPIIEGVGAARIKYDDFFYAPQVETIFGDANAGGGAYNDTRFEYEESVYSSPIPFADSKGNVPFFVYDAVAISKNCEELEAAWDFVKFLMGYDYEITEGGFDLSNFYRAYPIQKEMFTSMMASYYEWRYDKTIIGHTTALTKEAAVEKVVAKVMTQVGLASKLSLVNDRGFSAIWWSSFNNYTYYKSVSLDETLKQLEKDLNNFLGK